MIWPGSTRLWSLLMSVMVRGSLERLEGMTVGFLSAVKIIKCNEVVLRGSEEYCDALGQVHIINSSIGKALGGASGRP